MTELRWNEIPGLTLKENDLMDDFAHGLVTPEGLEWLCRMAERWGRRED